ncbi:DMT family transporter [Aneurinibacillus sp. Ricciae_BoGa-3]|uniref:DMT family transporter n=1 Tax=Aneurinibacillus sp. Ricciae_BoGa-3 TaxID=3022697 RepID=UPI002340127B|nr:DMT family transporter [Aneurinibacillus sp. Ricciae_BoGa-3]WCK52665.1 DMT family transporter [Aneurinibacillus sp. Ricciae_BoGa-3]
MSKLSRTKSVTLITFLVLVWGVCWPIYKIALSYTPPILFAGMRTLFGGLLLAALLIPKRDQIRWNENWPIYLVSSIFNVMLFYGLQTIGLRYMPAGLFSVIVYLQPVLVGIFAWAWLGESMSAVKVIGLVIGFIGVAAVSAEGFSGHISTLGILLALITAFSWAIGTVYVKKHSFKVDSMWLSAMQCIIGGIVLTGVGSGFESWSSIVWNTPYVFGLIFGIVLGISASWVVYFILVGSGDASKVASYTFLVPLISVLCGTLFLNEPFTVYLVVGLILIGVSIYLVNRKTKPRMKQVEEAA